jgi:hypothetical protein
VGLARQRRDERGVILVWTTIMLVVFLGVAAFSVDIAYWHLERGRQQRAADAAALAGAINWPGDSSGANTSALDVAQRNGYAVGSITSIANTATCQLPSGTVAICSGSGKQPYQYKVTIAKKVKNLFGGIFGIDDTIVRASATAEYLKPLSMGSPSNQFGNDPDASFTWPVSASSPPQTYPNFWANIAGGNSTKTNGDAYAADNCNTSTDGCTGSGFGNNLNYIANGYYYAVDFTGSGTVNLQAFDPAFTNVGDLCTDGSTNLAAAAALTNVPGYPQGATNTADISKRYARVTNSANQQDPGFRYCTGDQLFGTGPAPTTTFTVLKATVPGQPATATQVCQKTYAGYTGDVSGLLGSGGTVPGGTDRLSTYFRQWNTICQVSGAAGEQYFIQISTDHGSAGHNRFALRATTSGGTAASQVAVAGNTYMGIYANVGGGQTSQFYLARVPSAAAGHTLVLNFYDIGDAAAPGQLQIVPPTDSNVGATFSGCKWSGDSTHGALGYSVNTASAPWGNMGAIASCLITGVNASGTTWNGQWNTVTIPIPTNYTCNDSDQLGCWLKINYLFTAGVTDTTSWNAYLLGDPVRLTE